MTTITSPQDQNHEHPHRVRLGVAIAGAALASTAVLAGVGWHWGGDARTQTPASTHHRPSAGWARSDFVPMGGLDGHVPPIPPTTSGGRVQLGE